ncbi:MAG: VOC family protein [Actinomycetota bacterium]|nr:VOC family protein [Actinomycetota bacterium]
MTPTSRPAGTVAWVDLSTPELDVAAAFYEGLFGWALETSDTPMGRYVIGSVELSPVGGMMAPLEEPAPPPAWTVFFGTDDIDASYALAESAGATGMQPPMEIPGGDRIAVVADPVGAVVGLMHSTQEDGMAWGIPGAVAWVETTTDDVDASRVFYEKVFGWSCSEGTYQYWMFDHGGEPVAGMMPKPAGMSEQVPSSWMPYFAVDLVEDACDRATRLGGSVIVPIMTVETIRFAVVQDPAEAVFGVMQGLH